MHRFFEARERRYRLLRLSPELMMNVLFSPSRQECQVRWITVDGLAEGVQVESVRWDDASRCFELRLWHESFDVVPPGEYAPWVSPSLTLWQVKVPKTVLDNCFSNVVESDDV